MAQLRPEASQTPVEYEISAQGALLRKCAERVTALRALPDREPGEVRDFCRDATGTVFVAARGGLFIAAEHCDVLDRVDFDGEPPSGEPVGVACASNERLWLLTSTELCAVETRQFLSRQLEVDLPPPPYLGLNKRNDGRLELRHSGGVHELALEQLPEPVWGEAKLAAGSPGVDGVLSLAFGTPLRINLEPSAHLRWMWRDAARFRWLPIDGNELSIELERPGRQSFCVVAFDHAMRRSPQTTFEVDVAYPPSLRTRTLLILVGVPALGLLLSAAVFAWRRARTSREVLRSVLSAALFCLVTLQLLAAAFPHSKGWPFVGFTMYTRVAERDSISSRHEFLGRTAEGTWIPLAPPGGAFGKYETERALQPFLHDADGRRERFLAEWNANSSHAQLTAIADVCRRRRLTPDGPIDIPRVVMFVHPPEAAIELR